jgi:hypothetical protein
MKTNQKQVAAPSLGRGEPVAPHIRENPHMFAAVLIPAANPSIHISQCEIENCCCGLSAAQLAGKLARVRRIIERRKFHNSQCKMQNASAGRILRALRRGLDCFAREVTP